MIDVSDQKSMAGIIEFEYRIEKKRFIDNPYNRTPLEYFVIAKVTYTEAFRDYTHVEPAGYWGEVGIGSFKLKRDAVAAVESHKNQIAELRE